MPRRCEFGCSHSPGLTFHSFPHPERNPEGFKAWVRIVGGKLETAADVAIYRRKRICDVHFTYNHKNRNNRLNALAVPTLKLHGVVLHGMPNPAKFPERFQAWVSLLGGKLETPSDFELYKKKRVCDINFSDEHRNRYKRLNALAVPTLNLPGASMKPSVPACEPSTSEKATTPQPITTTTAEYEKLSSPALIKDPLVSASESSTSKEVTLRQPIPATTADLEKPSSPAPSMSPSLPDCELSTSQEATTPQPMTTTAEHEEPSSPVPSREMNEDRQRREYWKLKLKHILHSTQFCGLCLSTEGEMNTLNHDFEIIVDGRTDCTTLADIVNVVFNEEENLVGTKICNNCTNTLIQSYIFVQNARKTFKILNCYLDDMYNKTCYIRNNLLKKDETSNVYNVIIALDKHNIIGNYDSNKHKKDISTNCNIDLPSNKLKQPRSYAKDTFKCNICSKSYSSQQFLFKHYELHSKLTCKICQQKVQDGGLLEHLKEHHQHLIHLCSTCNIAFYSAEALATHHQEWHNIDDRQCLTCLKSYPRHELELHQCRFSCTSCIRAPCVHHKYLMYYREQILNDAPSAKCLDCNYVCKGKTVLIKHVNTQHLKHRPYTCEICAEKFYSELALKIHVSKNHPNVYKCHCNVEFSSLSLYERHIKSCECFNRKRKAKHRRVRRIGDIYPCVLCNRVFFNDSLLTKHIMQVHSGRYKKVVAALDCVVCQKKFATKADLLEHMKSHGPDVKYSCRICNIQYDTLRQYRAHNRKHEGPLAVCEVCGEQMRQILLEKHMTTTHADPVTCDTCGKSYRNITSLKYHRRAHLEPVPCPKCSKLINPIRLRRHYKTHFTQENGAKLQARS